MKRKHKRVQQSIRLIADALLELLEMKSFSDITISELCNAATVSRNTFYRLFSNKEDVLCCILEDKAGFILNQFLTLENFDLSHPSEADIRRTYKRFYSFWLKQQTLLEELHKQGLLWLLDKAFLNAIQEFGKETYDNLSDPSDPACFMDYYYFWHSIFVSKIIEKWVMRGCTETTDELVNIHIRLNQTMNYQ